MTSVTIMVRVRAKATVRDTGKGRITAMERVSDAYDGLSVVQYFPTLLLILTQACLS